MKKAMLREVLEKQRRELEGVTEEVKVAPKETPKKKRATRKTKKSGK